MKALLIGLDGAVFQGDGIVPGVDRWISDLRESGMPHLFITNTSTCPRSDIVAKLGRHGIHVQPQEILTPAVACAQWLCEHSIEKLALQIPRETAEDLVGFEIVPLSGGDSSPDAILIGDIKPGKYVWRAATFLIDEGEVVKIWTPAQEIELTE